MCVCMRASVCACVYVCVRACVCVCVHVRLYVCVCIFYLLNAVSLGHFTPVSLFRLW